MLFRDGSSTPRRNSYRVGIRRETVGGVVGGTMTKGVWSWKEVDGAVLFRGGSSTLGRNSWRSEI